MTGAGRWLHTFTPGQVVAGRFHGRRVWLLCNDGRSNSEGRESRAEPGLLYDATIQTDEPRTCHREPKPTHNSPARYFVRLGSPLRLVRR